MDGFPNGRRLEDDVTRIELMAVSGVALAAIGLWYDDFVAGSSPVTTKLVNVLSYKTGVESNDISFRAGFPYVAMPWAGDSSCGGVLADSSTAVAMASFLGFNPASVQTTKNVNLDL